MIKMPRHKNLHQEDNLTENIYTRLCPKDYRQFEYLAEKECLSLASLFRRIVLLYLKNGVEEDKNK